VVAEVDTEEGDKMTDQNTNLCIRCGKQRVVVKTEKEYINSSLISTAITSCPDDACQGFVNVILGKEKLLREKIVENHEREKLLREKRMRRGRIRRKLLENNHTIK